MIKFVNKDSLVVATLEDEDTEPRFKDKKSNKEKEKKDEEEVDEHPPADASTV